MNENTNGNSGIYMFGPAEQKGGKDLTPAIRVLEEKIRQMELMRSA
ncbi:hypothetical protein B4145_2273 [Bacillus subtilis]|uniref:Uncharacterized protein n=1 Tax=Bacillus subtilis subsp. subtilis TaxID=135461 RepID=A0ABD3ZQV2_BACIU|nr:hypothetical protein B4067_2357 [Bacillus subtilis subsp. subtilis]KIN49904.1 hypothetical protein B4145_2273 [Bacillus subtilis]MBT2169100.1 hypothetical protein [Bacillus subtilis]MBW4824370.1 hypothetical protein [Bacillaceae bacterium]CAF1781210.1 hypothetical protein NRS6108_03796 [Bacillus subtilis]